MVKNQTIDVAILPFVYTEERSKIADYLMLLGQEYGNIYIRNPRETFDWEVYTKPLRKEAWIGLFLFCSVVPLLMMITVFDCKILLIWSVSQLIRLFLQIYLSGMTNYIYQRQ